MDLCTENAAERKEQARRFREKDADLWSHLCRRIGIVVAVLKTRTAYFNIDRDDWIQETAKRLWTTRARYDPEKANLASWVWVVGKHVLVDMVKSRALRAQNLETNYDEESIAYPDIRDSDERQPLQAVQDVREVVTELPARERMIIEHTGAARELASEIGLSAGAIRVYKHRILAKLRSKLQQRGYS
jgi:RNA polymerase sigma factor (sigma-70 family)